MGQHIFLLIKSALIGWDFLETHNAHTSFSQKGEMYLELYESDAEPTEKTMILKEASQAEINLQAKYLLQSIPMEFCSLFSTDIDKIKSATPIKRTIDNTLPLPS